MEIFKTDILKKELEKFQKENLVEILKCGYCQKTASQSWHRKFLVSYKFCREAFCKACHKNFENFVKGFFCISSETLHTNFQVSEVVRVPIEKTFKVKSCHKSNKNRSQVVYKKFDNCEKLTHTVKGKPCTFYKKF